MHNGLILIIFANVRHLVMDYIWFLLERFGLLTMCVLSQDIDGNLFCGFGFVYHDLRSAALSVILLMKEHRRIM